jgi:hypothetical protein
MTSLYRLESSSWCLYSRWSSLLKYTPRILQSYDNAISLISLRSTHSWPQSILLTVHRSKIRSDNEQSNVPLSFHCHILPGSPNVTNLERCSLYRYWQMERHIVPLFLIVGLMFIRLCTTSKCNYLTYNTTLYTRGKEERGKRKEEKGNGTIS